MPKDGERTYKNAVREGLDLVEINLCEALRPVLLARHPGGIPDAYYNRDGDSLELVSLLNFLIEIQEPPNRHFRSKTLRRYAGDVKQARHNVHHSGIISRERAEEELIAMARLLQEVGRPEGASDVTAVRDALSAKAKPDVSAPVSTPKTATPPAGQVQPAAGGYGTLAGPVIQPVGVTQNRLSPGAPTTVAPSGNGVSIGVPADAARAQETRTANAEKNSLGPPRLTPEDALELMRATAIGRDKAMWVWAFVNAQWPQAVGEWARGVADAVSRGWTPGSDRRLDVFECVAGLACFYSAERKRYESTLFFDLPQHRDKEILPVAHYSLRVENFEAIYQMARYGHLLRVGQRSEAEELMRSWQLRTKRESNRSLLGSILRQPKESPQDFMSRLSLQVACKVSILAESPPVRDLGEALAFHGIPASESSSPFNWQYWLVPK